MFVDKKDFHASGPLIRPDKSIILIRDRRKTNPLWKFAGGKKQLVKHFGKKRRGETPIECFIRECQEETGIRPKKKETDYVTSEDMGHYNKHYFISWLSSDKTPFKLSNEYEEPEIFTISDLKWLTDFHSQYRDIFFGHMLPLIEARA